MPLPIEQLSAHHFFVLPKWRPVVGVEVFDDLECPPSEKYVAADHLSRQLSGKLIMAGTAQLIAGFAEEEIRTADQLMKRIQVSARAFDPFQGFGYLSDGLDRRIIHIVRPLVIVLRPVVIRSHCPDVPASAPA